MAATNFTPIILYHSVTASAAPTAGNLNNGELAINITDGKLFYKDNGGVVQIIATKGTGVIGGSNNQVQYNSSGALAGSANFTFDGTTATINTLNLTTVLDETYGGTGLTSYTTGDVIYASGSNTLAKLAIGANTYILTSTGSVPQWSAPSAVSVSTATNLAGGTAGAVPYQSGVGATTFLSIGTNNQVLTSTGSAPQWVSGLSLTTLSTSGNTTLGDAAADNLTINATVTSNLIFTDNTYDIGANGATRPRTIYVGTSVFSPLVDTTNLEVTNIKALDGTAALSIADSTGVVSVSANPVLSGGTANGVVYLNASKSATSGSALTFDGTNFATTGNINAGNDKFLAFSASAASASNFSLYGSTTTTVLNGPSGGVVQFNINNVEQMRLTSTGLGIGTSSPGAKLDVADATQATGAIMRLTNSASSSAWVAGDVIGQIDFYSTDASLAGTKAQIKSFADTGTSSVGINYSALSFSTMLNGTFAERMRLDSSGNLGLGVTPSAWGTGAPWRVIDIQGGSLFSNGTLNSGMGMNWYNNGTNYIYKATGRALEYEQAFDGTHRWYNAPSGTANSASVTSGASYTVVALGSSTLAQWQAFFNDSSNNPLTVTPTLGQVLTGNATGTLLGGGLVTQNISFTQAMTLDASGNLLVGGTSNALGARAILENVAGNQLGLRYTSIATYYNSVDSSGNLIWTKDGNERARITSGGSLELKRASNSAQNSVVFNTTVQDALTLDSSGNLGLGVTPSVAYGKEFTFGGGDAVAGAGAKELNTANGNAYYAFNALNTGAFTWQYRSSQGAVLYQQNGASSPSHTWHIAPPGTAGNAITFTQAMTLDASGNLSVGTTSNLLSAASRVTVSVNGTSSSAIAFGVGDTRRGHIYVDGTETVFAAGQNGQSQIMALQVNGAERARITSGGNFGIGTTSPQAPLEVQTASTGNTIQTAASLFYPNNTGGGSSGVRLDFAANNSGNTRVVYSSVWSLITSNSAHNGDLVFGTANSGTVAERARITSGGVFILGSGEGTATVSGNTFRAPSAVGTNIAGASLTIASGNGTGTGGSGIIAFQTAAAGGSGTTANTMTECARITSGGYFKASNAGTYNNSAGAYHELYSNASGDWIGYFTQATASNPNGVVIQYTAAAPNGAANTFLYCNDNAAVRATIRSNGGIANYQANDVNLSDQRTKKDIVAAPSYWDKIKGIEIVHFKYKDQTHDDNNVGVIAQQVEQVAPEFVDQDGWGETPEDGVPLKSIYTSDMYHAAIKALQEAMARIEKLEAEVAALKGV